MKFYDKKNKRLAVFEESATSQFWDKHWQINDVDFDVKQGKRNWFVKRYTTKFLDKGFRILEGGCGIGQNVYGLKCWGYDAYGVDFAQETIKRTKNAFPELKLSVQDVKRLDFPASFFDGYWSLGVIEHCFNGFNEILKEAGRVIRPKGFLFLTFPFMSPLRRVKAKLGLYQAFESEQSNNFYEFILNADLVKKEAKKYGFIVKASCPFDAVKGLKDEISFLRFVFQKLYDSKNIVSRGIRFLSSILLSKFAGHCVLLVFQKE